jgi:quercetin dioxygenase-like cupin family protein
MFYKNNSEGFHNVLKGITIKTLVYGDNMLLSEFHMNKGSQLPNHSHSQEQTGRLIAGKIVLTIGNSKLEMNPGDCWSVPSNTSHGAEIVEDAIAIEVFSPVREDYLQYK